MELKDYIVYYRRLIHQNPEIGFETFKTAKIVKYALEELGYKTKYILNQAGVIGYLDLGKEKTIGFRADMDALKINEMTDLEFKSTNGCMHACGHDSHTAMLLGSAKVFMENKDKLKYNVTLIFQCAEEGPLPGGAYTLININKELPKLDEIYALHVSNNYPSGTIALNKKAAYSAADFFDITIKGEGGHGAKPELANNPNIPCAELVLKINNYIEEVRKTEHCAFTVTRLESGKAYNVIPDTAMIKGTIRVQSLELQQVIHDKALELCDEVAKKYHVTIVFDHHYGYPPLINHEENYEKICKAAERAGVSFKTLDDATMVAEDFAYYLQKVPGCMFWLGVHEEGKPVEDLHSPKFTLDENALTTPAKIYLELLTH